MSTQVFIVSGCRTPIGSFQGQFEKYAASDLGSIAIVEALKRAELKPEDVNEVIMGQVLTAGQGQNPARQAALGADLPNTIPAFGVNMLCGSGLKAVCLAYQAIKCDDCEIIVAGGQESMTRAQHSVYARGARFGGLQLSDSLLTDGLTDAFNKVHMGKTAEHLAKKYEIDRKAQDEFALSSQLKTQVAVERGHFKKEIVGVPDIRTGKFIELDEFPKSNCTMDGLAKLKTAFDSNGTVTAGNASGINDGAAVLVLVNERQLKEHNLNPAARIVAWAQVALDPMCMGLGPIEAVKKVLTKAGWNKTEVDLYELNEAFAVQSIIVIENLGLDASKVNVSGGAIALGHPIGASGARVLVTLIHSLERLGKHKGIAALCVGGGMGIAIAVERP